jgi:hypothetical protein
VIYICANFFLSGQNIIDTCRVVKATELNFKDVEHLIIGMAGKVFKLCSIFSPLLMLLLHKL